MRTHAKIHWMLLILLVFFLSKTAHSQQEPLEDVGNDEIILQTENTEGSTEHFVAEAQSVRWDSSGYLTTSYASSDRYIYGDCIGCHPPEGWDFVRSPDYGDPVVAVGLYKIYNYSHTSAYFYVDLRDDRNYGPDVFYKYNAGNYSWKWRRPDDLYTQYRAISSGDTLRLWEECGQGNPSTSSFQPTDASNLSISNYGGHPKLTWTGSEPGNSAKYIVYRNSSAITEPPLSSLSYVDQDITLGGGFNISYTVRAVSGDGSKYSTNYSNTVSTQGWYSKPADTTVAVTPGDRILTGNFPNPFNPETRITFALNDRSHVHLLAYDVLGREVSRLIDGDLDPGNHEAVWRGSDQNGRKLPSGMYVCELQHRRGTERMKMMLVR